MASADMEIRVFMLLLLWTCAASIVLAQPLPGSCSVTRPCANGLCCSQWGFCGTSESYCGQGCVSQCHNTPPPPPSPPPPSPPFPPGSCSVTRPCNGGLCCSQWGFCGTSESYCGQGCVSQCHNTPPPPPPPSPPFPPGSCSVTRPCANGLCCSQWGFCGTSESYCGQGCVSQCHNTPPPPPPPSPPFPPGSCSVTRPCNSGLCCSQWGYCGTSELYCGEGCVSQCRNTLPLPSSPPPPSPPSLPPGPAQEGFIVTYWGQNGSEGTLLQACLTGHYKILVLAFIFSSGEGNPPLLNLSGHCSPYNNGCVGLTQDITTCQDNGVKVFISIGGGSGAYKLTSPSDAKELATHVWNSYLGGNDNSFPRPLGSAVLDGVDFDIEGGGSAYYSDLAESLKSYYQSGAKKFYLSAAPQCPFPDAWLGPAGPDTALGTGLFDYVWVQFYNNPQCQYNPDGDYQRVLKSWSTWTSALPGSKIFMGLPASPSTSTGEYRLDKGFMPSNVVIDDVLPRLRTSSNYGGVMLRSYYYDQNASFGREIIGAVRGDTVELQDPAKQLRV